MEKDYLTLERAPLTRLSREWKDDDYDVLADGEIVGRIFNAGVSVARPWMWTLDSDTTNTAARHMATLRHARPPWQRLPRAGGTNDLSGLFLETSNLATDLPRFIQNHLSINPAALCRCEFHLAKEAS
jgi:hypothetical protein